MIADILQLAEVMRGDHRRHAAVYELLRDQRLRGLTHDRVEAVEGLVEQKVLRAGSDPAKERDLLFHSLGEGLDPAVLIEAEIMEKLLRRRPVKGRIESGVYVDHFRRRRVGVEELLVRNVEELFFRFHVLVDRHAVDGERSVILPVDPRQDPKERRLAGAVRADEPEDFAVRDRKIDVVDCFYAAE